MRTAPLVIASNRGPVEFSTGPDGASVARPGGGGLVNVLGPALAARDGIWVAGTLTEADERVARETSGLLDVDVAGGTVALHQVLTDPADRRAFYHRVSTSTLWFLHHQLFDPTRGPSFGAAFDADWRAYERVNDAFAAACAARAAPDGAVLLQDYHLAAAPALLRARRPDLRIAHFTMCPWAEPGYFAMLPERYARRLVEGMLGATILAFLVPRWADNFLACAAALGYPVDRSAKTVRGTGGGLTTVRCYGVGVDPDGLRSRAAAPAVRTEAAGLERVIGGRRLILRVDRMEPAKNVLRGVAAFGDLLAAHPAHTDRVTHYVLAYTSRADLPEYQRYGADVAAAVAAVNARFGTTDWQPVILDTRNNLDRALALMARADVLVVNPLRDGMNLVAKEGPVVSERDVALVLSRGAGAADELAAGASLVDPFDTAALTAAMAEALRMPVAERRRRLALLRQAAGALPPRQWIADVLGDLAVTEPHAARRADTPAGPRRISPAVPAATD